jgi:hypothetical protein
MSYSNGGGGGLRVCGCLWRIASDDLVLPAWIEFFFRLVGVAVLVCVLAFEEITALSCASQFHLNVYLIVAIVHFSFTLANLLLLALESAKGSIWDSNPAARRWVTPFLYVNIVLTVGEFLWALTGSVWVVRGLTADCMKTMTDFPLYAISAVIIATWVGLSLKVLLFAVSYNTCSERNADNTELFVTDSNPGLVSRLLSLCMDRSQINFFTDVANVLSEVFDRLRTATALRQTEHGAGGGGHCRAANRRHRLKDLHKTLAGARGLLRR